MNLSVFRNAKVYTATVLTQKPTIKGLNLNSPILYGEQVCILSEQLIMLYVNK